jgi:hypothetical protein
MALSPDGNFLFVYGITYHDQTIIFDVESLFTIKKYV